MERFYNVIKRQFSKYIKADVNDLMKKTFNIYNKKRDMRGDTEILRHQYESFIDIPTKFTDRKLVKEAYDGIDLKSKLDKKVIEALKNNNLPLLLNTDEFINELSQGNFNPMSEDFVKSKFANHLIGLGALDLKEVKDSSQILYNAMQKIGSKIFQELHTDGSTLYYKTEDQVDYTILSFSNNREKIGTVIIPLKRILESLNEETIKTLEKPNFIFDDRGKKMHQPILYKDDKDGGSYSIKYTNTVKSAKDESSKEALDLLKSAIKLYYNKNKNDHVIVSEKPCIIVFDNKKNIHCQEDHVKAMEGNTRTVIGYGYTEKINKGGSSNML